MGTGNLQTMASGAARRKWKVTSGLLPFPWLWYTVGWSCKSNGEGMKYLQALQFPEGPNSLDQAGIGALGPFYITYHGVLGSSAALALPVRCTRGWLPELLVRRWCILLVCREQSPHAGVQATLTGQEKASAWEYHLFLSSFKPELHISASHFSCVVSLHL